jgi:pimeloyl-[acyl-carrier protein] methyl ester esterase
MSPFVPLIADPQQQSRIRAAEGRLPLIMLPGLDGAGLAFGPLVELLPPSIVTYPRDRVMGYQELLPLVTGMLPNDPFVLLGESFSSPLAITIAASRPRGLRGLILSSAFARNPLWLAPNWLAPLAHPLVFRLYNPYIRFKAWWRGSGPHSAARLAAVSGLRPQVVANRARSALRVNVMQQLSSCPVPVMYIRGERDRLVHRRNLEEMSECLPSMCVVRLDGGHCVLRSQAALAAAAIVEFIADCDRRTANDQVPRKSEEEAERDPARAV